MEYRTERDSMGEVKVPVDALYGASTQRAVDNFPVSGLTVDRRIIWAFGLLKGSAAEVSGADGHVEAEQAAAIRRAADDHRNTPFDPYRSGLHHLCFRARSREDVDGVHECVARLGARIVHPPREDDWAPGYYSVLFEDPDGIRLEVSFVPGAGNLDPSVELPLPASQQRRLSEPSRPR